MPYDIGHQASSYVRRDGYGRARRVWTEIEKLRTACFTGNFVLDETFTLLGRQRRTPSPPSGLGPSSVPRRSQSCPTPKTSWRP